MPRRSSYASVVSGSASALNYQQPARSGAFSHLLNQTHELPYDTHFHQHGGPYRHESRSLDLDMYRNLGSYGGPGSWGRSGQLPSFSSAFGMLTNGYGYEGIGGNAEPFFVPSYLKGSKYVRKLEEAFKAKMAMRREAPSTHSSQPGSLSTSNSSANLHAKLASSHRGMQFDLIEKAPPLDDDGLAPLPSKWNSHDKSGGLEVQGDGQEVKFTGSRSSSERDHEASSIRTDHPIPPQCGIYYFEVTILSRKREEYAPFEILSAVARSNLSRRTTVCIGFSSKEVSLSKPPGWEQQSWAYHGDDGHSYCCQSSGKHYGPPYTAGDVIGCGINFRTGCAFFTKNGDNLGRSYRSELISSKCHIYPFLSAGFP
jgi:Ran-binding protein 9/10